jgi:RNA polymerase sigma factor (sigma-70 family)
MPHEKSLKEISCSPVAESKWFAEEVQPHESTLRAYLRSRYSAAGDVDDLLQETYLRILRVKDFRVIRSTRAFLFSVARRLAVDQVRRERRGGIHEPVTDFSAIHVLEGGKNIPDTVSTRQEVGLLAEAIDALPPRCREIIILRKLDGLSHREIAARLGLSEETVQVQIGRGMRRCADYLRKRGLPVNT